MRNNLGPWMEQTMKIVYNDLNFGRYERFVALYVKSLQTIFTVSRFEEFGTIREAQLVIRKFGNYNVDKAIVFAVLGC